MVIKPINKDIKAEFISAWSNPDNKRIVITHRNCEDGRATGSVALQFSNDIDVLPPSICYVNYGEYDIDHILNMVKGAVVYIGDFSFLADEFKLITEVAKIAVTVDHHRTPYLDSVSDLPTTHFDMSKSGAYLAWEFFYPNAEVPKYIKYVSDRDLYTFKYGNDSRALHLATSSMALNSAALTVPYFTDTALLDSIIAEYTPKVERHLNDCKRRAREASPITVAGVQFRCLNICDNISDTLNAVCALYGTPAMSYRFKGDVVTFSIRNNSNVDVDLSELAKLFGGGGHPKASGFAIPILEFNCNKFHVGKELNP